MVKFKATEIENEIGQNLQMEFYANTADHEKIQIVPYFEKMYSIWFTMLWKGNEGGFLPPHHLILSG